MTNPPILIRGAASFDRSRVADLAVVGPADQLAIAYRDGAPITLDGTYAGESVHLGIVEPTGLDDDPVRRIGLLGSEFTAPGGPFAGAQLGAYIIDPNRLDGAPRLAEAIRKSNNAATLRAAEKIEQARAEERELSRDAD